MASTVDPFNQNKVVKKKDANGNTYYEIVRTLGVSPRGIHGTYEKPSTYGASSVAKRSDYRPLNVTLRIPEWFFNPLKIDVEIPEELFKPEEVIQGTVPEIAVPIVLDEKDNKEVVIKEKVQKGSGKYHGEHLVGWLRRMIVGEKKFKTIKKEEK